MAEELDIITELENLLDRRPFQPFVIVMQSGERYDVTGRHQVAVGKRVVVLLGANTPSIHMRSDHISSLEERQPAEGAA